MKKYFFFAAAALLALAACSKVNYVEEPDQEINFSVVNRLNGTKAEDADNKGHLEFYTGKTFSVFAFSNSAKWDDETSSVNAKYMNDVAISNKGTADAPIWRANDAYYWPKTAYLSFAAYSPSDASAPKITKVDAKPAAEGEDQGTPASISYEFSGYQVAADNKAEYKDDLMVSEFERDLQANPDKTHFTAGVPILFNHLLSKLTFKFNRALYNNPNVDEENSFITLTGVEIVHPYNKGSYANVAGAFDTNPWTVNTDSFDEKSVVSGNAASLKLDADVTAEVPAEADFIDWGYSIIVLPQVLGTTTGEGESAVTTLGPQKLKLYYTITTQYKPEEGQETGAIIVEQNEDGSPLETEVSLYLKTIESWDINKSIVYNVTISPTTKEVILFDPAIVPWTPNTPPAGTVTIQ